jgi:hypothetical protein
LRTIVPNSKVVLEEFSNSNKFAPKQIDLINNLSINQKIIVDKITVIGSDGLKRKLKPLVFTIDCK